MTANDLASLPPTFTYGQARAAGLSNRRIYALRDAGEIEQVGRGVYRQAGGALIDLDLAEALVRAPEATLCLVSALLHHELTDIIPDAHDLALPRGRRHPADVGNVRWHTFDRDTFSLGREYATVGGNATMHVYTATRSIVDAFRMRAAIGPDVANEALRRWLRLGGQPSDVLSIARRLPAVLPAIRRALEVLL